MFELALKRNIFGQLRYISGSGKHITYGYLIGSYVTLKGMESSNRGIHTYLACGEKWKWKWGRKVRNKNKSKKSIQASNESVK